MPYCCLQSQGPALPFHFLSLLCLHRVSLSSGTPHYPQEFLFSGTPRYSGGGFVFLLVVLEIKFS